MKALSFDGELRLIDAPRPSPAEGEVLVEVLRAGICATDLEIVRGYMNYRGVLGHEFVGRVAAGKSRLAGRRVAVEINCACGNCDLCARGLATHCRRRTVIGIDGRPGAFAEFIAVPERNCHVVPDEVSDDEAVFIEPLAAAFQIVRQVPVDSRTRVTVLGSGRLGLLCAQVLHAAGCRLTVVGRNSLTLGWLDRKGIQTGTAAELRTVLDQDVVVDCTGSPEGLPLAMRLVRPRGVIVLKTTCAAGAPLNLSPLVIHEISLIGSRCGPFADAISALGRRQIEVQSLVTGSLPLSRGVEAMQMADAPNQIKVLLRMHE